jgi:hypothetical protein
MVLSIMPMARMSTWIGSFIGTVILPQVDQFPMFFWTF